MWMKVKTQNWQLMDYSFNEEFEILKHINQQLCRMSKRISCFRSNYKFLMRKWGDERCPVWHIMVNEQNKIFGDHSISLPVRLFYRWDSKLCKKGQSMELNHQTGHISGFQTLAAWNSFDVNKKVWGSHHKNTLKYDLAILNIICNTS